MSDNIKSVNIEVTVNDNDMSFVFTTTNVDRSKDQMHLGKYKNVKPDTWKNALAQLANCLEILPNRSRASGVHSIVRYDSVDPDKAREAWMLLNDVLDEE